MAVIQDTLRKLKEELKCSICHELYSEPPKFLQCNHLFCNTCLEKLVVHGNLPGPSVTCPTCRKQTVLPKKGVADLQSGNHIQPLLDVCPMLEQASSTKCGKCDEENMNAFCHSCQEFICIGCQDIHQRWKELRTHNITQISDDINFLEVLLAKQEDTMFSTIKENLGTIGDALQAFKVREKELHDKQIEVETIINKTVDDMIQKLEERRVHLIESIEKVTRMKLGELADQKMKVESVKMMFKSSLYSAVSSLSSARGREQLLGSVKMSVSEAKAKLKTTPLHPQVNADMTLVDTDGFHKACSSFGCISSGAICATNSVASGDGLRYARIDESIAVILHPKDTQGNEYTKQVKVTAELLHYHTRSPGIIHSIEPQSQCQYTVVYQPLLAGEHTLQLCIDGNHISGSPFAVSVLPTVECFKNRLFSVANLLKPTGIVTDTKGNIIIVQRDGHCISIDSATGYEKIKTFGSQGSGRCQFINPYGVAVDKHDNIYVTDSGNHRIQKFTPDGTLISEVGSKGSERLQFENPMGIAYNSLDGHLYVCDSDNCRVVVLNCDLTYCDSFGIKGSGRDQFQYPCNIAFDHRGQIYVTEYYTNYRVQVFSSNKRHLNFIQDKGTKGKLCNPHGIAFDSGDTMYVSEADSHCISIFDKSNKFACCCGSRGSALNQFSSPNAVHVDQNDSILIADTNNNRVVIFN